MVDARNFFKPTFVTLKEVADGPLQVTISGVAEGSYNKLTLSFTGGVFNFSLNATNSRTLARIYGADTDDWLDMTIELYSGEVEFQGKMQPAVLVRPITPAPVRKKPKPATADDEIAF